VLVLRVLVLVVPTTLGPPPSPPLSYSSAGVPGALGNAPHFYGTVLDHVHLHVARLVSLPQHGDGDLAHTSSEDLFQTGRRMRGSFDVRSTEVAARCTGDGKLLPSNVHFPDASHHVLEVRRHSRQQRQSNRLSCMQVSARKYPSHEYERLRPTLAHYAIRRESYRHARYCLKHCILFTKNR
jgi:hypothetical protein